MPGDQRGDPILPQTGSLNVREAPTSEGVRPEVAQDFTRSVIQASGLVVSLAFVELPLGFMQADYPSCKIAFNVIYISWTVAGATSLTRLCLSNPLICNRLPIAAVFIVVSAWLLRFECEFEPSFILIVAPIISTFLALLALFYQSEKLSAFASFVFGLWQAEFRVSDLKIMLGI